MTQKNKLQIALEFLIIYSFVLVIFLIIFLVIANQKSSLINIESYSSLQLIAQNIANYMNYAQIAGTGFSIAIPLVGNINNIPYYISISSTGVVYANMTIGNQKITAIALSNVHNLIINGTLTASSNSNTINLYSIPVYTGTLYIANKQGIIYINQYPPVTFNLPSNINIINSFGNLSYFASFNGNGIINETKPLAWLSYPAQNYTFSIWVNPSTASGLILFQFNSSNELRDSAISLVNGNVIVSVAGSSSEVCLPLGNIPLNQWTNIAMTNDVASTGNYLTGYINGKQMNQISYSLGSWSTPQPQLRYDLGGVINPNGAWNCGTYASFSGQMSDFQIYNTSLSSYQISSQLYDEGIGGIPLSNAGLSLWYPLQGNANDYSGNNNNGVPYNTNFNKTNAVFLAANIRNQTGYLVNTSLVGYVSKYGKMSTYGNYTAMKNNPQVVNVQYNGIISDQVQSTMFNGNLSTIKNLKLWYPLDYEYSMNATYDLSGSNNTGIASNVLFNGTISNQSSFMQGIFNGNSFVKSSQQLNINSNELTISAWVDLKQNNTQNIASVFNSSNSLQIMIINGKAGIALNNKKLSGSSVSDNLLYFITGVWNGYNNTISIYVNGLLNNITSASSIYGMNINAFSIGNSTSAANSLNGIISNVQIYNQSLTQQQIIQLYLQGPASIPAANHVIAWLPLDGNSNDYSQNNYKTVAQNINFINLQQSTDFYKTHIPPFSVIAWGVNDTVPSSDLSYVNGRPFIPYAWVAANPTHPTNITVIQKGYFPITIFNDTSFGWTYRTTPYSTIAYGLNYPLFPNNVSDNLNFLNNGYVKGTDPDGINASLGVYNDTYFSAVGYIYLNGKYNIIMQSNDGQEIFWKNILNNKWQNLSNGTEWGPAGYIETEKPILFNPGIYEFAVNWVNLAGGGFSDFFIAKKSNNSITNYASFNGKGYINETSPFQWLKDPAPNATFSIWVNPFNSSGVIINEFACINCNRITAMSIFNNNVYVGIQNTTELVCLSLGSISLNQWTNIAMTYSSSSSGNYLTGYINGKQMNAIKIGGIPLLGTYPNYLALGPGSPPLAAGEWNCGTLASYSGQMSDFQIYNTSLSPYQVSQLYDQGIPKTITTNIST